MDKYFRSVVEQDRCAVVICDTSHTIIYMNPAARERYKTRGELVGKSIFQCHNERSNEIIRKVFGGFEKSRENDRVFTFHSDKENKDVYMIALRDENGALIGYYEKHEYRGPETSAPYTLR